jgi:hypothetical protein
VCVSLEVGKLERKTKHGAYFKDLSQHYSISAAEAAKILGQYGWHSGYKPKPGPLE